MPYPSYIQMKDSAGGNIYEMKGWRWDRLVERNVRLHPLLSFPGSGAVNETLALDFGENYRKDGLQGRLQTNRQLERLRGLARDSWFDKAPTTLTIGDGGADTMTVTNGLVDRVHADWNESNQYYTVTIGYVEGLVFPLWG